MAINNVYRKRKEATRQNAGEVQFTKQFMSRCSINCVFIEGGEVMNKKVLVLGFVGLVVQNCLTIGSANSRLAAAHVLQMG